MKKAVLIFLFLALIINFAYRIDLTRTSHDIIGELMYFPSGRALRIFSMGFYAPLADLIWLRFIQYYGEHRLSDRKFEMMYHILDILTSLDMNFVYAYTLGGLMLTHDAQRPDQAKKILKKGMYAKPEEWRHPFMYGFIHYVFLKDYRVAQTYYRLSAQKPDAPDMARRWAAFVTFLKLGDRETSLKMWVDYYNSTDNPEEKILAEIYIKRINMELDIEFLNSKVAKYKEIFGTYPYSLKQLVLVGLIDSIPPEPHDGNYFIRNGKVYSTYRQD